MIDNEKFTKNNKFTKNKRVIFITDYLIYKRKPFTLKLTTGNCVNVSHPVIQTSPQSHKLTYYSY